MTHTPEPWPELSENGPMLWYCFDDGTERVAMLRETDLLLVPSRAEGFGLQTLESVAVGTPVVATDCTGMSEWAHTFEGVRWVETGDMAPCLPGYGRAPALDPGHLADVIENAVRDLRALRGEALMASPTVRRKWAWEKVLAGSALDKLTAA